MPLTLANVLYRGSVLRNTAEAVGLVVNAGEECKIRLNASKNVRAKKPAMQAAINRMVLFQIAIVAGLAAGLTVGYHLWRRRVEARSPYLDGARVPIRQVFFGYLVMFNTLIPLSLYISMEIIKIGQLLLMHDVHMYDPASDTPMVANTTTILENLGQVTHLFSDKTGTMTENVMRFRKLSVAGAACLHHRRHLNDDDDDGHDDDRHDRSKNNKGKSTTTTTTTTTTTVVEEGVEEKESFHGLGGVHHFSSSSSSSSASRRGEMNTRELLDYIRHKPNTTFSRKAMHFLLCIALCHTCLPETGPDGRIAYQAASPDELALVEAARDMGLVVVDRPAQAIRLRRQTRDGQPAPTETYQVLDVIEFSSRRKRMSVVVRMPDGRLCLICKGADNVITSRLRLSHLAQEKARAIGRRASVRKTFEQEQAMRRMSGGSLHATTPRTSLAERRKRASGGASLDLARLAAAGRAGQKTTMMMQESAVTPTTMTMTTMTTMTTTTTTPPPFSPTRGSPADPVVSRSPRWSLDDFGIADSGAGGPGPGVGRVDESLAANDASVFERCFQHVDDFATDGLRTLLYAYRYLDEESYARWKRLYREAETSLVDRERLVEEAGEQLETGLELAGATAIEDKLQEGVAETIDKLRRAGIKVWMLTGDKRETAINIGHSARLCKPYSEVYVLDAAGPGGLEGLREALTATLTDVCRGMVPHSVVVVDGQTLAAVEADAAGLAALFGDLAVRVDSVICCRASPAQKAALVKSIRRRLAGSMTLAVGDGANDIGMIQASHVGVGISGREGLQAARIADYAVAQFRFLQRLLLVHGRWNYIRTGKYVLATFWKEVLFFLVQAHYQRLDGYSGTSLFESASLTVFNTAFTSLPVILLGIFERDLAPETLLAFPELYALGQRRLGFNFAQYLGWMLMAVAGSFVIFYTAYGTEARALFTSDTSLFAMGNICFTVAVVFINVKLLVLELHCKTVITFTGFVLSVGGWFLWNVVLSFVYAESAGPYPVRDAFFHNFGRQASWT
ncbi:hypothetical protein CDD83_4319 [Cordyceps sp. RAO-2017]|nr:hypothetical protein CDD83_4319 [Cordyceps sp. RAO-2017]